MTAEILRQAIETNIASTIATICLMLYFFGTAFIFIKNPLKYGKKLFSSTCWQRRQNRDKSILWRYFSSSWLIPWISCFRLRKTFLFALWRSLLFQCGVLDTPYFHLCRQRLEVSLYKTSNPSRRFFYRRALDMLCHRNCCWRQWNNIKWKSFWVFLQ